MLHWWPISITDNKEGWRLAFFCLKVTSINEEIGRDGVSKPKETESLGLPSLAVTDQEQNQPEYDALEQDSSNSYDKTKK